MKTGICRAGLLCYLLTLLFANALQSQTTWTGSTSTSWTNASNWSAGVPGSSTDAIITSRCSRYPELGSVSAGTILCRDLYIEDGGTVNSTGDSDAYTINGSLTMEEGAVLNLSNGEMRIENDVDIGGAFYMSGGSIVLKGNWNDSEGVFQMSGGTLIFGTVSGTRTLRSASCNYFNNIQIGGTSSSATTLRLNTEIVVNGNIEWVNCAYSAYKTFDANGYKISCGGNWLNRGEFVAGSGRVVFKGGASQSVTSNSDAFYDVEIKNTADPSSAQVSLADGMQISHGLILTDGVLSIGNQTLELGTNSSNISITGGSSASYLITGGNGVISTHVNTTGSYFFPVGDLTHYTPVTELQLTSGTISNATIQMKVSSGKHSQLGSGSDYLNRYWSFSASGITSPVYNITYVYDNSDISGDESLILPTKWGHHNGTDNWAGPAEGNFTVTLGNGYINPATNTLTWSNFNSFSDFTGSGGSNPLPVSLTGFNAECASGGVSLNWSTVSETNNDYFVAEYSSDALNFDEAGRVSGAGNSNHPMLYHLELPGYGTGYYRLSQIDFDGKTTAYMPVYAGCSTVHNMHPPEVKYSDNQLLVLIFAETGTRSCIQIIGPDGRIFYSRSILLEAGSNQFRILFPYSPGIYLLRIPGCLPVRFVKTPGRG